jgi:hypothetical protein
MGKFWAINSRGPLEKSQEMTHYMFCQRQKITLHILRIIGSLVFLCPIRSGKFRGQKGLDPLKKISQNDQLYVLPAKKRTIDESAGNYISKPCA